jgi:hypothetical protein
LVVRRLSHTYRHAAVFDNDPGRGQTLMMPPSINFTAAADELRRQEFACLSAGVTLHIEAFRSMTADACTEIQEKRSKRISLKNEADRAKTRSDWRRWSIAHSFVGS